ncbi:hypothetical protein [Flammeovirga sp. OC4]|uniref:hypothetical protein n=1 Tax=Flammeovirga sp. OC4 TaxID=1382345 RepID=UPI0005C7A303|nr:hypothetical protein [Flammeovirga sp. OC4]
MQTYFSTVLLIFVLALSANAQLRYEPVMTTGEKHGKGLAESNMYLVGKTDQHLIYLSGKGKGTAIGVGIMDPIAIGTKIALHLSFYNKKLDLVKEVSLGEIKMMALNGANDKNYEFTYQDQEGVIWVIYSTGSKGMNRLYRTRLNDAQTGFEKPILISQQRIGSDKISKQGTYNIKLSDDKNLLCVYSISSNRKAENSNAYVHVFDHQFNSKWSMISKVPQYRKNNFTSKLSIGLDKVENFKDHKILLSNSGVLNIFNRVSGKKNTYAHLLYSFSEGKRNPIVKTFTNDKEYLKGLYLTEYEDQIGVIGYYANLETKGYKINGLYIELMDPIFLKTKNKKKIEFTNKNKVDFMTSGYYPKTSKYESKFVSKDENLRKKLEKGKEIGMGNSYYPLKLITNSNGTFTLVSEALTAMTTSSTSTFGGIATTDVSTKYTFGDICFVNFDKEGKIHWISNFHKYQKLEEGAALSGGVLLIENDDVLSFMYANVNVDKMQYGEISLENGKIESKDIYPLKNDKIEGHWLMMKSFNDYAPNSYIGLASKVFKTKMITLQLKEKSL